MNGRLQEPESEANAATGGTPPWLPTPVQLQRYATAEALADAAAKRVVDSAKRAVDRFDHFNLVLGAGETARRVWARLTEEPYRGAVPWARTYFVFADERCVPPDDERSHYRMARESLFDPLEIDEHRVLRMKGEDQPSDAARRYEVRLGDLFLIRPRRSFDLALLDVGSDGRIAALIPGTDAERESERWVVSNRVREPDEWRLTLTFPALDAAGRLLFLASGRSTARVVAEAFAGVPHPERHPCERVSATGTRREALVDAEAASGIPVPDEPGAEHATAEE